MLRLLRFVSLRHLVHAPLRTALTACGIAFGVALMVSIAAVNRAVLDSFRSMVETVAGRADLTVSSGQSGFAEDLVDRVRAVPGVEAASGTLSIIAPVVGSPGESLYVMAVDLAGDATFRDYRSAEGPDVGDPLAFLNSDDALLVSERFAAAHHLAKDSRFELETAEGRKSFVVKGLLKDEGPVKAFGGAFAVMDLYSAQAGFSRARKIDRVDVTVKAGESVEAVKDRIAAALHGAFEVERPKRRGGSVTKMLRSFQMGLNLSSGVALLVGVFLVYNTVSISVLQRRREVGTLRALGATRGAIRGLFALEGMVLGVAGSAVGIPFGAALAQGAVKYTAGVISSIYIQVNAPAAAVTPIEMGYGLLLGVVGSVLAALFPAARASAVAPVEALKRDLASSLEARGAIWPVALGAILLAAAGPLCLLPPPAENFPLGAYLAIFAVMLGTALTTQLAILGVRGGLRPVASWLLRVAGRLAADNFARAPGRSAVPVAAMGMGVAMTLCIAAYVGSFKDSAEAWVDQSVPADLFVTASARFAGVQNTPMSPKLAPAIESIPGVEGVDKVRLVSHDYDGLRLIVLALDPDIYFRRGVIDFVEGGRGDTADPVRRGSVLISENLSKRRNLHTGGVVRLATPTGVHDFPIAGVIRDYTSDQGFVAMARGEYVRRFQDDLVDVFEIYARPGADLERIRRAVLERLGDRLSLFVLTNQEFRAELKKLIDEAFQITYAMELVAVLLALLGVVNTLLAAVLDRTREIGLLRAVGASRSQVVCAYAAEAGLIGAGGGAVGVFAGSLMGLIVVYVVGEQVTGWTVPFVYPSAVSVQMCAAAIATAVLAGLYPARRAASVDVVEALAYE